MKHADSLGPISLNTQLLPEENYPTRHIIWYFD